MIIRNIGKFAAGIIITIIFFGASVIGAQQETKKYDKVEAYKDDGFALVRLNNKVGLIDKNGKEVVPCIYDMIAGTIIIYKDGYMSGYFSDGLALAQKDNKYGFVDQNGKEVTPFKYVEARPVIEGMAPVQLELSGKWGYINQYGEEIIPFKYAGTSDFENGFASVSLDGKKWIYIDKEGNEYATKKAVQKALNNSKQKKIDR